MQELISTRPDLAKAAGIVDSDSFFEWMKRAAGTKSRPPINNYLHQAARELEQERARYTLPRIEGWEGLEGTGAEQMEQLLANADASSRRPRAAQEPEGGPGLRVEFRPSTWPLSTGDAGSNAVPSIKNA